MSLEEVNEYKSLLEKTDSNQVNLEKVSLLKDKAIKNSFTTNTFAVDMQTTCRGEDCYINMYSLFDKMFNQYFSFDMVLSSASPILMNTASRVFLNNKLAKNVFNYIPNTLKKTKIIKENGFWDNLLDDPVNLFKNPKSQFNRALQLKKNKYNVDALISQINYNSAIRGGTSLADTQRNLQHYGLWDDAKEVIRKSQNKKEIKEFISEKIVKNKNISPAQKNLFADFIIQQNENAKIIRGFAEVRMSDDLVQQALKKIDDNVKAGRTLSKDWFTGPNALTKEEYDSLFSATQDLTKLGKEFKNTTFGEFNWNEGFSDFDVVKNRTGYGTITHGGETIDLDGIKLNQVTSGAKTGEIPDDTFLITKKGDQYTYEKASELRLATQEATNPVGVNVSKLKVKANLPDFSTTISNIDSFDKEIINNWIETNPNNFIRYVDDAGNVKTQNLSLFKDSTKLDDLTTATNFQLFKGKNIELPEEYGIDPIELAYASLRDEKNIVGKYDGFSKNMDEVLNAVENQEWVSPRGVNYINQKMKMVANPAYPTKFLTNIQKSFGSNLYYWQLRSGFSNFFGSSIGLDKYSMYRLPETYSALNITHNLTPDIYNDAYVDFFANEGSDQGDLFMSFLNSAVFLVPYFAKQIIGGVEGKLPESIDSSLDNLLRGKIKRNEVDNLALFTDTINTGCNSGNCKFTISNPKYIESKTYNKSINISEEEVKKSYLGEKSDEYIEKQKEKAKEYYSYQAIQEKYNEMDNIVNTLKEQLITTGTDEETAEKIASQYRAKYKQQIDAMKPTVEQKVNDKVNNVDKTLNVSFSVPGGLSIQSYLLENTSEKNLEDKGQNIISFSHHTNYDSTTLDESTSKKIDLQEAINNEETCEAKLRNLQLLGLPIGWATPKNYRAAATMAITENLSYILLPGYKNKWIAAAFTTSIPQQTLIMPEIYGCVDDKEGYYTHFFVSKYATENIEDDQKNKVGNMVEKGVNSVEKTLTSVTKDTQLENTVKTSTQTAKKFIEKNLKDYPIVQAKFTTSGDTTANVNGGLFHFEIGPGTSCRANSLVDKGVEILKNEKKDRAIKIDKEKGDMSILNADGSIEEIINKNNSDFVRLTSTNLNIPAKVIPQKLSYIPVPDNNKLLFEIDAAGNMYVLNESFLDCLKSGFKAQSGYAIPDGLNHIEEFLGKVKNINVLNTLTEYNVYPQGTKIVAEGTPRQIADGTMSKVSIYGNRKTTLSKVNNKDSNIGINISIQFDNGQLLYSGEKDAYIMWVEYTSVTNSKDIKHLKSEVVKEDAINGCDDEELAINFEAVASNDDKESQTYYNVQKLNKALESVGPFKIFDTAEKTFIFYLSDPPECEQRLKIIDKKTGEVFDEKITDIQKTPDGLKVKTEDGSEHDFSFSADNGVPEVKYNGDTETLLGAQGKNGSFWYDPKTGNWYTENGQLIPFENGFKDGMMFGVDDDGNVRGKEAQNIFNIGQQGGGTSSNSPFNIPLTPNKQIYTLLYLSSIISLLFISYLNFNKKNK
jgi:hypothetical protein